MRRFTFFLILLALLSAVVSACTAAPQASTAMEEYLKALVAKDGNRLSTLSCGAWEADAQQTLDSFAGVEAKLADVVCKQTGTDGDKALVTCTGNIVATYNGENQNFDLSTSTYILTKQNDEWLVCGQK
jgi:outer membrane lipoprotein-sorting protein